MRKTFMGVQLRRLREERGMTQVALARALGLSASYLNQIEQNQRPMTVPMLLKINAELGVDVQRFSDDEEARLIAGLCDVLAEQPASAAPPGASGVTGAATQVSMAEIRELAASMPAVARTLMGLHARHRQALERLEALSMRLGDDRGDRGDEGGAVLPPMAYEEVRDFFFAQHNHIAELDDAAERCALEWALVPGRAEAGLVQRLAQAHGVRCVTLAPDAPAMAGGAQRLFDAASGVLQLSSLLEPGQRAFQMATQLAFLEMEPVLQRLAQDARLTS